LLLVWHIYFKMTDWTWLWKLVNRQRKIRMFWEDFLLFRVVDWSDSQAYNLVHLEILLIKNQISKSHQAKIKHPYSSELDVWHDEKINNFKQLTEKWQSYTCKIITYLKNKTSIIIIIISRICRLFNHEIIIFFFLRMKIILWWNKNLIEYFNLQTIKQNISSDLRCVKKVKEHAKKNEIAVSHL